MHRLRWLVAGAMLGVVSASWARRRIERLAERVAPGSVAGRVSDAVRGALGGASDRVQDALDVGRLEARRRAEELRSDLHPVRDPTSRIRRSR